MLCVGGRGPYKYKYSQTQQRRAQGNFEGGGRVAANGNTSRTLCLAQKGTWEVLQRWAQGSRGGC
ncbi:hypothetical protein CCMA1212_008772 [Trichoderma ghanense]|uniref:Uncharacterized protein n=1 Tax=Trichoderma ghanense TaxID=65468 RepID=A0ABY2GUV8_9HYPO